MYNLGFQGKCLGKLFEQMWERGGEKVIVHHITNHDDYIQLELEVWYKGRVQFCREKITQKEFDMLLDL